MKKNKAMRMASVLLVCVLLTTSIISGTFAKYTTSASSTDSARVAKFGVTITANGDTFAQEYDQDDKSFTLTSGKSVAVGSANKMDLVAPGTKGTMTKVSLSGTPEVAVVVSYQGAFELTDDYWVVNSAFYCPLVITVNDQQNTPNVIDGKNYTSAIDFENAVNTAINSKGAYYAPNTDLSTIGSDALTVSWQWPFSTSTDNDAKDTALGNQAAQGNFAQVTLAVTTTVTQID